MKKHLEIIFASLRSVLLATVTAAMIFGPTSALAATNTANWDIGGAAQTGSTINLFTYSAGSVTLTKAAFLTDGTALADNATVPAGTQVQFMIYARNTNAFTMNDISISDALNPLEFTMVSTDFQIDNSQTDVATEAAIYTAVDGSLTTATFIAADDVASFVADTINVGTTGGDLVLNIPGNTTWAIIFTVTII